MSAGADETRCGLAVVGAGLAGLSAALFAAAGGVDVVVIGGPGELQFTSGLMDLLGVHPVESGRRRRDPWAALEGLAKAAPEHPMSRVAPDDIRTAFGSVLRCLEGQGLSYRRREDANVDVPTFAGTLKRTYAVPLTMWHAVEAVEARRPCCIVGLEGLKGFSARQVVEGLSEAMPGSVAAAVRFPGTEGEVFPSHVAGLLEDADRRAAFADAVRPHLAGAAAAGMPALIGRDRNREILADLVDRIGVPVFEVPTLPPSMAGLRLRQAFERGLAATGRVRIFHQKIGHVEARGDRWRLWLRKGRRPKSVLSDGVLLATGRFFGGGLAADRRGIREALMGLPVHQPGNRDRWHREDPFDPRGHRISRAGLEVDDAFRPLDRTGRFHAETLHAAGSVLAHQDWKRMKCGSGLAVASAFGAVKAFLETRGRRPAPTAADDAG
jgi:glycerol-3-phosphate dehydrogenase subunit B